MSGTSIDSSSGVESRATSWGKYIYFDSNSTSMFEAFFLFMQKKQVKDYKEGMANKAF